MLIFTTEDSLKKPVRWLDLKKMPRVEAHGFYQWVDDSLGRLAKTPPEVPTIVVIDFEGLPTQQDITDAVKALISQENVAVLCTQVSQDEANEELRALLAKRGQADYFRADLSIPLRNIPGLAEALGVEPLDSAQGK